MAKENKPINPRPWVLIIAIAVIVFVLWYFGTYNSLVSQQQSVNAQWAQVETQYQRKYDLIPNLVNSVKGYMQFEKDVLENVTAARSQWGQAQASGSVPYQVAASTGLDNAISRLLVVMENYPDLKTNTEVQGLMDQLEGTENRISVERMRYNDQVQQYDTSIKMFPTSIVANMNGFTTISYYNSTVGANIAPIVNLTVT
jgi:LemA protein